MSEQKKCYTFGGMLYEINDTYHLAVCSAEVAAFVVRSLVYGGSNIL